MSVCVNAFGFCRTNSAKPSHSFSGPFIFSHLLLPVKLEVAILMARPSFMWLSWCSASAAASSAAISSSVGRPPMCGKGGASSKFCVDEDDDEEEKVARVEVLLVVV